MSVYYGLTVHFEWIIYTSIIAYWLIKWKCTSREHEKNMETQKHQSFLMQFIFTHTIFSPCTFTVIVGVMAVDLVINGDAVITS